MGSFSYTRQVKTEVASAALGSIPCCWSELWGLSGRDEEPESPETPWLVAGSALMARRAYRLMKYIGLEPSIRLGRHPERLSFEVRGGDVPALPIEDAVGHCPQGFLRGAFLARGYVADMERPTHLEIVAPSNEYGEALASALALLHFHAKYAVRRGLMLAYLKDREQIARLMALLGAHRAVLALESQRVVKSMKNQVNRLVNSETANLRRTVESGTEHAERLVRLRQKGAFARLAPELLRIAELRIQHPDWSLKELGHRMTPTLTKSQVNHRMRRLRQWMDNEAGNL